LVGLAFRSGIPESQKENPHMISHGGPLKMEPDD
jgi:hypothetical protein